MRSGKLRHRITVQRKTETVDPVTGYRTWSWADILVDVPADWLPGPGKEYLASEALRAEVQGRFELRWSPDSAGIRAADRVLWDSAIYDVKSDPLVDATARREIMLMVARGINDG